MNFLNPLRIFEETGLARPSSLLEDFMRDMWSPMLAPSRIEGLTRYTPRVNVIEKADAYELDCELPGIRPEDVKVNLTGDTLTIQGEKTCEDKREGDTWHVTECSYGAFQRTFTFPAHVDAENIEATHENGLLKIRVAKTKESQARRIEIKSGAKQLQTTAKEVPVSTGEQKKATAAKK